MTQCKWSTLHYTNILLPTSGHERFGLPQQTMLLHELKIIKCHGSTALMCCTPYPSNVRWELQEKSDITGHIYPDIY